MVESKTSNRQDNTNITASLPYSWLSQVSKELKTLDSIPLFGTPPAFPWEEFSHLLSKPLNIPELKIAPGETKWREKEDLFEGLGENHLCYSFAISPFEDPIYFAISKIELKNLLLLSIKSESDFASLEQEGWLEEFYKFLFLEVAHTLEKTSFDHDLSLRLLEEPKSPETPCLCLDIQILTPSQNFRGRLFYTPSLQKAFQKKYTPSHLSYPPGFSEAVTLPIHVTCGSVHLSRKEWGESSPGDFVILDSCTIDPEHDKARVVLMVQNTPLFRGKIKDGNIKILEYPQLQEVQTQMVKDYEHEDEEFDHEFDTDDDFIHDEKSSFEDTEMEDEHSDLTESHSDVKENHSFDDQELSEAPTQEQEPEKTELAPPSQFHKIDDIPMTITVEVARIQMSLQQLMQLAPGNMLELDVKPENGVDLVVNGRCIGKGELLKIGDTLGVRILDKV